MTRRVSDAITFATAEGGCFTMRDVRTGSDADVGFLFGAQSGTA